MKKLLIMVLAATAVLTSCSQQKTVENPLLAEWNTPFGIPPFVQVKNRAFYACIC